MSTEQEGNKKREYQVLPENYPNYDLSFKIILIGNSGNISFIINNSI